MHSDVYLSGDEACVTSSSFPVRYLLLFVPVFSESRVLRFLYQQKTTCLWIPEDKSF